MPDEPKDAWAGLHDATPPGWYVGQPMEHPERNEWAMFAFDTTERPVGGQAVEGVDRGGTERVGGRADDGELPHGAW